VTFLLRFLLRDGVSLHKGIAFIHRVVTMCPLSVVKVEELVVGTQHMHQPGRSVLNLRSIILTKDVLSIHAMSEVQFLSFS
jgi:hypothetical protein